MPPPLTQIRAQLLRHRIANMSASEAAGSTIHCDLSHLPDHHRPCLDAGMIHRTIHLSRPSSEWLVLILILRFLWTLFAGMKHSCPAASVKVDGSICNLYYSMDLEHLEDKEG